MQEVEIKLKEEEYIDFLKLLYFADYCASSGLISAFKDRTNANKLPHILNKVYSAGDKLNLPKSISFTSLASRIRFSEEEHHDMKDSVESDLENIAKKVFARDLAKQDLKNILEAIGEDDPLFTKRKIISKRAKYYAKEFEDNGVKNLRFKLFYKLSEPEETDD